MTIKGLNIFHPVTTKVHGPTTTLLNLLKGLESLGIEVVSNDNNSKFPKVHFSGDLQPHQINQKFYLSGPNVLNHTKYNEFSTRYHNKNRNYILGSKWLQKTFEHYDASVITKFWKWGIDTEFWQPTISEFKQKQGCFIYSKNRDTSSIHSFCANMGITSSQISYGSYDHKDLLEACRRHRFCIVATRQESNPNFLLEILSMNIPCIVLDWSDHWLPELKGKISTSSATEWTNLFGYKLKLHNNLYDLETFKAAIINLNENYNDYNPRSIIKKEYSLECGAKNYLDILGTVI